MKDITIDMPIKYGTDKDRMDVLAASIEVALKALGLNISVKTSIKTVSGGNNIEFLFTREED